MEESVQGWDDGFGVVQPIAVERHKDTGYGVIRDVSYKWNAETHLTAGLSLPEDIASGRPKAMRRLRQRFVSQEYTSLHHMKHTCFPLGSRLRGQIWTE